jgi:15-cis-phytoene synthase
VSVSEADRHCQSLTRSAAANFYYGIRLLGPDKRGAICAVYAFARRVDDIADGPGQAGEKLALLQSAELDARQPSSSSSDPVIVALAGAHARFGLPLDALVELIDGVRMDIEGRRYASFEELHDYCRCVAGSIGRLCVAVFGASDPQHAPLLADELGVAMQLTNILRDLREDSEAGRLYIPTEDLDRFGLGADDLLKADPAALQELTIFQVARAREWFERGIELVGLLDHRSAACVLAMTGIYRRLLERIERRPRSSARERVSLPAWEKAWVAGRSMVGAAL